MAARGKRSYEEFKKDMAEMRKNTTTCKGTGKKKTEKVNILERQELVVQRLSAVSGNAQKYKRVGPREFVQYDEEELTIDGIKRAYERHFSSFLELRGLTCDVLAGEQGPSCFAVRQIPDLKVLYVRFIYSTSTGREHRSAIASVTTSTSNLRQHFRQPSTPPRRTEVKRPATTTRSLAPPRKQTKVTPVPRSLSISEMLKVGKLVKPIDSSSSVLEIYSFDLGDISWSILPEKAEFTIEKKLLGQGGFRKAFKATSRSHKFSGTTWVVKFY